MSATIISGRDLAEEVLSDLSEVAKNLKMVPTIAVIQIGENPSSTSYIKQKQKAAERISAKLIHFAYEEKAIPKKLINKIAELNSDPTINGIIVQRPVPKKFESSGLLDSIINDKDIDGFNQNSPFDPPIARAVLKVLETIKNLQGGNHIPSAALSSKSILILGVGETGGGPIAKTFEKLKIKYEPADIKTPEKKRLKLIKNADVIISCVGKANLITGSMIKTGAICIGVGISRSDDNKLKGDFDEETINDVAGFYTPTPGGTGPLNVAFLMSNLVDATKKAESL